jgi:hypothetical protein
VLQDRSLRFAAGFVSGRPKENVEIRREGRGTKTLIGKTIASFCAKRKMLKKKN